jgi:hypothetical protein
VARRWKTERRAARGEGRAWPAAASEWDEDGTPGIYDPGLVASQ